MPDPTGEQLNTPPAVAADEKSASTIVTPAPKVEAVKAEPVADATKVAPADPVKPAEAKPEGEVKVEAKPAEEAAPVYEFKLPEDVKFEPATIDAFKKLAADQKISPAQAQQLVDFQAKLAREGADAQNGALAKIQTDWRTESMKKFSQDDINNAQAAIAVGADDEVRAFLNESKLGDHPMLIRLFSRLGAQLGEDRFETGRALSGGEKKSAAELLYPSTKPN